MPHLEHDRLVFLALGESGSDQGEATHLDTCAHCRGELETLRHVAGLATATQPLRDLPAPPEHLWQGIRAEIEAAQELSSPTEARELPSRAEARELPSLTAVRGGQQTAPTSRRHQVDRRRRRLTRWALTAATATAAAVLGVVGTLAVVRSTEPAQEQVVLASAPLSAYGPTPPEARGEARVLDDGRLHLHVANLPEVPGYYEVWLINPVNGEMFSVGVLGAGSDVLLPLPAKVDLRAYNVVDVSAEQFDNDPAHSGDSLLRGTLTG
ncbi:MULTISPECIES: anti-sigma factor [Micromonospora]|uniref:Anti-sigma-K factor rskA n=1 Tax=Micromonospora yangpuensis TaxID=683228 RepID=A0A1C6UA76_9ACTN|nr:anti-sigma factor [Micromonospora yangpuensis]GGL87596.1 hypothetical protein GCM10012279_01610 [Micromonospora yangpuensis]SCL50995.1 Anti-sigma-K factor rskA [Micromonospora yangpuensis]